MSVTQESEGHAISKYISLTVRQRISGWMDQLCQSWKVHYPATSCMYYIAKYNASRIKWSIITFTDGVEVDNCKNESLGEDDLDAEKYALTVFRPSEYCTCGINRKSKCHLNVRTINWLDQVKKNWISALNIIPEYITIDTIYFVYVHRLCHWIICEWTFISWVRHL